MRGQTIFSTTSRFTMLSHEYAAFPNMLATDLSIAL
jgi:hypothetical protein